MMAESSDKAGRERTLDDIQPKHDIFMSHQGLQKDFTHQFSKDLRQEGYCPFFDQWSDSLPKGERFAERILKAAKLCKMAVVVLSPEYMIAKWPMVELNAFCMAQCSTRPELILFPVFYKLRPEDLSDESKLAAWEKEWEKHQKEDTKEGRIDIKSWRKAVNQLRGINGLRFPDSGGSEVRYREDLVNEIYKKLKPCLRYDLSGIQGCNRLCEIVEGMFEPNTNGNAQGVQKMGLYGMGGVGKTTMCKALCNHFQERFQGRVCHVEVGPGEKYLDLQKKVLKILTNLGNQALQDITDSEQAQLQMKSRMGEQDVFLAVDNVEDSDSSRQQALGFLNCTFSAGSKLLVTGRCLEVVEDVLGSCGGHGVCVPVPNVDGIEALSIFLDKAAPGRCISSLSAEEKSVVVKCVKQACFSGKYHPLALRALASYYNNVAGNNPLAWEEHLNDIHKLRPCKESDSKTIFRILGLGFDTLSKTEKLLFLDAALFMPGSIYFDISTIEWLSAMHEEKTSTIRWKLKNLVRMTYLNEIPEDFGRITVHELYREFAVWHIAQSSEEDANKAICLYCIGERLPTILKKGRADKCLEELSRVFISGLRRLKTLPSHSNEWPYVVVLQLEKCPDLTSLNLHGMESLQHLTVKFCEKLEKIEGSVEEQCLCDLRYVQLEANYVLKSIPRIWRCAELVCVDIAFCPQLLLQSMDAEACPKLERLSTEWSCWMGIAQVALTQNLQELRVNGGAQRSFEDVELEQSVDIEDVEESVLNEALCPVLDLNNAPDKGEYSTKEYGCKLRVLRLSNLSLQYSKFLSTLRELQELHLDEVHLIDEGTLCLEGCIHLEKLTIGGGNVHTVTGIGELIVLRTVDLFSMKDLRYLPDWPRGDDRRPGKLLIRECDKMDVHNGDLHVDNGEENHAVLFFRAMELWMTTNNWDKSLVVSYIDCLHKFTNAVQDGEIATRRRGELANRQLHLGF